MPKTRQKAKGIGRKMPKRSTRAKPPAPSIEDLKASIIKLADGVEDLMAKRPRPVFLMANPYDFPPLAEARRQSQLLWNDLARVWDDPEKVDAWLDETLSDPHGAIPRWSRRGSFMVWLDYLPMLVTWSGILHPDITAVAVDPAQSFVKLMPVDNTRNKAELEKQRQAPSAGYLGLGSYRRIAPKWNSVLDMVTATFDDISKSLFLATLTPEAKQSVRDTLVTEPWIGELLARGPVHRVSMPQHLMAIQQTLFA